MRIHGRAAPIQSPTALRKGNLRRILGFLAPYWQRLLLILATVAAAAAAGLAPPLLVRGIIDSAIEQNNPQLLLLLSAALFAAAVLLGLIGVLRSYLGAIVSQRIMYDLKLRMFARLQSLSLRFYTQSRTGELMSRLTSDIAGIDAVVSGTLVTISQNALILATTLAAMLALDWRLSLVSLIVLPWLIIPTLAVGRMRRRLRSERQQRAAAINSLMAESLGISGLMLIKTFTREHEVFNRFQRDNHDLMNLQVREALVGRWYFMLLFIVSTGGPAVIYWFGGAQVISGNLTIGTIIAFVALLARLYTPATDLMSLHVDLVTSAAYFERIFEYLDLEPDIANSPGAVDIHNPAGALAFRNIVMEYTPGQRALDNLNFTVPPGQTAALVGPSGAGKTTITYLIPRLYDPTHGQILLDGLNIRTLSLESLRSHIGYVSQETFLFHDTIDANLRVARPAASRADIIEACRAASVLDVIETLPQGFDTIVGERGYRLSGGEKQRLAIARMLLKDPRIVILDEATSSLDSHSERAVQTALARLTEKRTTIVIAHRLSTVLTADIILYIENGKVAECGSHAELMTLNQRYAELCREQFAPTTTTQPQPSPRLSTLP